MNSLVRTVLCDMLCFSAGKGFDHGRLLFGSNVNLAMVLSDRLVEKIVAHTRYRLVEWYICCTFCCGRPGAKQVFESPVWRQCMHPHATCYHEVSCSGTVVRGRASRQYKTLLTLRRRLLQQYSSLIEPRASPPTYQCCCREHQGC